jgi:L-threonylcarbamoyladenylate synthase
MSSPARHASGPRRRITADLFMTVDAGGYRPVPPRATDVGLFIYKLSMKDKPPIARPEAGAILPANDGSIRLAGDILRGGGLVGLPTETVYGLAANATDAEAILRIYEAKGRPRFNPLISHVADLEQAQAHGVFDTTALTLAEALWPGPLTLVVPQRPGSAISDFARAGLDSVALRIPGKPVARAIIAAAGHPLAAPSANRSGRISPTTARDVVAELGGKVDLVIDDGPSDVGIESTVVACLGGKATLLRPGGVLRNVLEELIGAALDSPAEPKGRLISPGMLASHYAPLAAVHMNVTLAPRDHAVLNFGTENIIDSNHRGAVINLSHRGDLREAAMRLFSALRELDATGPAAISIAPIPMDGLGEAINDRLSRAAAPRDFLRSH